MRDPPQGSPRGAHAKASTAVESTRPALLIERPETRERLSSSKGRVIKNISMKGCDRPFGRLLKILIVLSSRAMWYDC